MERRDGAQGWERRDGALFCFFVLERNEVSSESGLSKVRGWANLGGPPHLQPALYIKITSTSICMCVYYCSTYYKAVRVGGGG